MGAVSSNLVTAPSSQPTGGGSNPFASAMGMLFGGLGTMTGNPLLSMVGGMFDGGNNPLVQAMSTMKQMEMLQQLMGGGTAGVMGAAKPSAPDMGKSTAAPNAMPASPQSTYRQPSQSPSNPSSWYGKQAFKPTNSIPFTGGTAGHQMGQTLQPPVGAHSGQTMGQVMPPAPSLVDLLDARVHEMATGAPPVAYPSYYSPNTSFYGPQTLTNMLDERVSNMARQYGY